MTPEHSLSDNAPRQLPRYMSGESDVFIGTRKRLRRYLVCSLEGYFPVQVKTGPESSAVLMRTGGPHVGPSGTLAMTVTADGGKSWSDPVEIQPRWEDSRNGALGINSRGELIAAFHKSAYYVYDAAEDGTGLKYVGPRREIARNMPTIWYNKSADGGRTWSPCKTYDSQLIEMGPPFGRIINAPDGSMLMAFYGYSREEPESALSVSGLLRSTDGGETWGDETVTARGYNETAYTFLPDGRLLAAARSNGSNSAGSISTLSSNDGGRTWTEPVQITRSWEHPADLTVLQSGNVLLSFGRRNIPMGCGALVSEDGGRTWDSSREVMLAGDSHSMDCGYPSTVQFDDGRIVTVIYLADHSEMAPGPGSWGRVSCQAIQYREEDIR